MSPPRGVQPPAASPRPTACSAAGSHFGGDWPLPALLLARALCVANNSRLPGATQRFPPHTQGSTEVTSHGTGTTEPGHPPKVSLEISKFSGPVQLCDPPSLSPFLKPQYEGCGHSLASLSGVTRGADPRWRTGLARLLLTGLFICSANVLDAPPCVCHLSRPRGRERMRQDPHSARGSGSYAQTWGPWELNESGGVGVGVVASPGLGVETVSAQRHLAEITVDSGP